jgi:hypothetical protein
LVETKGDEIMKAFRIAYAGLAWLFVAGVLVQVFLAGMVVVARQMGWDNHISLGHMLGAPLILMLITVYAGRFPGRMKRLTWLLFGVYILQADVIIFMRASAPALSALHPVLALVDFALGLVLAWKATAIVRAGETAAPGIPVAADGLSTD